MRSISTYFKSIIFMSFMALNFLARPVQANDEQIAGVYKGVLLHEGSNFYQLAKITLRTINVGGQIKISANTRVFLETGIQMNI